MTEKRRQWKKWCQKYVIKNSEKLRARRKELKVLFFSQHPEFSKEHYQQHREEIRAHARRHWYLNGHRYLRKNRKRLQEYLDSRRRLVPEKHYAINAKASKKYRAKLYGIKKRLVDLFGGRCTRCSITDHRVLDFDHIDPMTKRFSLCVGSMRKPWETLIEEAKKCQLLCSNCHRIKTIENGDWSNRRMQRKFMAQNAAAQIGPEQALQLA